MTRHAASLSSQVLIFPGNTSLTGIRSLLVLIFSLLIHFRSSLKITYLFAQWFSNWKNKQIDFHFHGAQKLHINTVICYSTTNMDVLLITYWTTSLASVHPLLTSYVTHFTVSAFGWSCFVGVGSLWTQLTGAHSCTVLELSLVKNPVLSIWITKLLFDGR